LKRDAQLGQVMIMRADSLLTLNLYREPVVTWQGRANALPGSTIYAIVGIAILSV
jgi:hypothetical protein